MYCGHATLNPNAHFLVLLLAVPRPGFYLNVTNLAIPCPRNTFCLGGNRTTAPQPCSITTVSLPGSSDASACSAWRSCCYPSQG
jgi:hypothetical protein